MRGAWPRVSEDAVDSQASAIESGRRLEPRGRAALCQSIGEVAGAVLPQQGEVLFRRTGRDIVGARAAHYSLCRGRIGEEAFRRERRIKEWRRSWKLMLIETDNPTWRDLFPELNLNA